MNIFVEREEQTLTIFFILLRFNTFYFMTYFVELVSMDSWDGGWLKEDKEGE